MPRVLICSVGGQPDPIIGAIHKSSPLDLVVFLCSRGKGESGSVRILRSPSQRVFSMQCPFCERTVQDVKRFPPILPAAGIDEKNVRVSTVDDPDDLEEVLRVCAEVDQELARLWPAGGVEVLANFTGGTKTMSLGLGIHALRRAAEGWRLQLNRTLPGGRTDLVRVTGGDHPVVQDLSFLDRHNDRETVSDLLASFRYQLAEQRLAATLATRTQGRSERAWLLRQHLVCRIERARERLDFTNALADCRQDPQLRDLLESRLARLVEIAGALEGPGPWPDPALGGKELVDEIREHGRREVARGRYAGALACLIRSTTILARLRLRRLHDLDLAAEHRSASLEVFYEGLIERRDPLGRHYEANILRLAGGLRAWRELTGSGALRILDRAGWAAVAQSWQVWLDEALEIL